MLLAEVSAHAGTSIAEGWIDTHCHLDAPEFDADRAAVVARARAHGVSMLVLPCVQIAHMAKVRELAHECGYAYALGIHPLYVHQAQESDLAALQRALSAFAHDPRLVAVGEIGLDHFVPGLDRERQAVFYRAQLKMAREAGLPVILHVRRSADALLAGLRRHPVRGGIAHAFNGSVQQAQAFVQMGFALGFGGTLTFERALQIRRLAAELPQRAVVLETDAPDIPPHWLYRTREQRSADDLAGQAQGRNEPCELPRIAAVLAQLRGLDLPALCAQTSAAAVSALPKLADLLRSPQRLNLKAAG
jgi:TatD DNase family protein